MNEQLFLITITALFGLFSSIVIALVNKRLTSSQTTKSVAEEVEVLKSLSNNNVLNSTEKLHIKEKMRGKVLSLFYREQKIKNFNFFLKCLLVTTGLTLSLSTIYSLSDPFFSGSIGQLIIIWTDPYFRKLFLNGLDIDFVFLFIPTVVIFTFLSTKIFSPFINFYFSGKYGNRGYMFNDTTGELVKKDFTSQNSIVFIFLKIVIIIVFLFAVDSIAVDLSITVLSTDFGTYLDNFNLRQLSIKDPRKDIYELLQGFIKISSYVLAIFLFKQIIKKPT